ncbi:MAG: helix-turn-helix transcriptional regulator [Acidobacteriota bacterium]
MLHDGDSAELTLPDYLRRLRTLSGESLRSLSKRMGVSFGALGGYERGRNDPTLSVLRRYLEALPGATAHGLLGLRAIHPPAGTPAAATTTRVAFGVGAKLIRVSSGPRECTIEIEGLRPTIAPLSDAHVQVALLRLACVGSNSFLRQLEQAPWPARRKLSLIEGTARHEFRLPRDPSAGLSYRWSCPKKEARWPARVGDVKVAAEWLLTYPCERLILRTCAAESADGWRLFSWLPTGQGVDEDLTGWLNQGPSRARRRAPWTQVVIDAPTPWLRLALGRAKGEAEPRWEPSSRPVALTLLAARQSRSFSYRRMAQHLGVGSHATVLNAESGQDVSRATAAAYSRACQETPPQALLPQRPADGVLDRDWLWEHQRDLFGFEAREISKDLELTSAGVARAVVRVTGLKELREWKQELRVPLTLLRSVLQDAPHVLARLETDAELKVGLHRDPHDQGEKVLKVPPARARHGLSFESRLETKDSALMLREDQVVGRPGPHHVGTSHSIRFPTQQLTVTVVFPEGYEPRELRGSSLPVALVPEVGLPEWSAWGAPPELRTWRRGGRLRVRFGVERPLVGEKHGISWRLP